jgi:hypothetical protein
MGRMGQWTLDELVRRAGRALAASDVRAPNGRVTPVPDVRMIRWYATIGLLDKPSGSRGRSALYGPRHLLQLVAVKRRQAQGYSLAEIQAELAGATEAVLRRVADIPPHLVLVPPVDAPPTEAPPPVDVPLMDVPPMEAPPTEAALTEAAPTEAALTEAAPARARFWSAPAPESPPPTPEAPAAAEPMEEPAAAEPPEEPAAAEPAGGRAAGRASGAVGDGIVHGLPLAGGALLLLPVRPAVDDLAAIRTAAGPLLDALAARGLLRAAPDPSDDSRQP